MNRSSVESFKRREKGKKETCLVLLVRLLLNGLDPTQLLQNGCWETM